MPINKVLYGTTTLIDLTEDTVTADKLAAGETAHDAAGEQITGTLETGSGSGDCIPVPAAAEVGQTVVVKAVDETGRPVEWEAADMPAALPNPNALTFSGAAAGSYDGSEPLTVEIPGGGRTLALIADVTTSEETNMISINKDLNGNAFTIRDYALRITIPAHTRSERATFYARTATYGGGLTFTNMLVTDGAEIGFFVYPIASYDALDLLDGSYPVKVQSISSRGANAHESAQGFYSEASSVQVYTNSTTVLFPAGVNVQVYGVRK